MAVTLATEVTNTGFTADHWVAAKATIDADLNVQAVYRLYKSAADFAAGKRHVAQITFLHPTKATGATTVAQIASALDTGVIATGAPLEGGVVV